MRWLHKHFMVANTRKRGVHTRLRSTCRQRWPELVWPSMGAKAWLRWVLLTLVRQAENPHKVALGFAVGVWVSFVPILGTHLLVAAVACYALRASFMAAFVGSWVGNPWTYYAMWWCGYQLGHRLLGLPEIDIKSLLSGTFSLSMVWYNAEVFWHGVIFPALIGGLIVGVPLSAPFYFVVRWQVRKFIKARRKRVQVKLNKVLA
jgi:uncharacterized protein